MRYFRQEESGAEVDSAPSPACCRTLMLGQAVHDVLEDSSLKKTQGAQALHRLRLKAADAGVHDPPSPQMIHVDIVQGHVVGDQSGQEAASVAFVVELLTGLRAGPPLKRSKRHDLQVVQAF